MSRKDLYVDNKILHHNILPFLLYMVYGISYMVKVVSIFYSVGEIFTVLSWNLPDGKVCSLYIHYLITLNMIL